MVHGIGQKAQRDAPLESPENSDESSVIARRKLIRSKIHVGLAAFGTLAAVAGIAVAIDGGLEFNRTKVLVGVGIIVVSTILYISMLFVEADE